MNKEDLYSHPGWQWCTSEGAELDALLILNPGEEIHHTRFMLLVWFKCRF